MMLKVGKLYYAKHKDRPSIFWETEYYFWGKTDNWVNVKNVSPGRAKFLDGRTFVITNCSSFHVLLYFPDLDVTIWEDVANIARMLEVFPFYQNINDLWSKVCLE